MTKTTTATISKILLLERLEEVSPFALLFLRCEVPSTKDPFIEVL